MSRFGDYFMKNKFMIGIGAILTGAVATALIVGSPGSSRKEIFRGNIGDWKVVYEESSGSNRLSATSGRVTVEYIDENPSRGIESNSKDLRPIGDKLELVLYQDQKGRESFARADIDNSTYRAQFENGVFESADRHYNLLRTQIRDVMRKEVSNRLSEIKEVLK